MKRKIVWLVVSGLMVLSLVMASCAPAAVEEEEKAPVTEEKAPEQKVEEEAVAPAVEKPKYGGVLKVGWSADLTEFDDVVGRSWTGPQAVTNDYLWGGDWARGAAGGYGTNETDWTGKFDFWDLDSGRIAESWELPNKIEGELATIIYHIRKGVHWALNPESEASRLVGGRELTVDDVVFSLKQVITDKRAYIYKSHPELRVAKITSPAPWTVKVEVPWNGFEAAVSRFGDFVGVVPPEVVAKYGTMSDWRVSVGSGPFMLTDFVPGSAATYARNPNYWGKDPVGPGKGNQLPYLDGVKYLIIPDASTMYAALRTAKIDQHGGWGAINSQGIPWEDAAILKKMTPQLMLKNLSLTQAGGAIAFKLDRAPFNDIRVRRALMMAIDFESIKRDLFGGEAQILTWPIAYVKEYTDAYLGLDDPECPESVKELYTYNPEKAMALLAEAGYPQGFKTSLILESDPEEIDYYSVITDMWRKVGIEVKLEPKETGAFKTIRTNHNFDQLATAMGAGIGQIYKLAYFWGPGAPLNASEVDDLVVNEAYPKVQMALVTSRAEANRLHKELMKHVLDQAWAIPRVAPYSYNLWWPWIKNYSGEVFLSFTSQWFTWVWLDQELKKSMGY